MDLTTLINYSIYLRPNLKIQKNFVFFFFCCEQVVHCALNENSYLSFFFYHIFMAPISIKHEMKFNFVQMSKFHTFCVAKLISRPFILCVFMQILFTFFSLIIYLLLVCLCFSSFVCSAAYLHKLLCTLFCRSKITITIPYIQNVRCVRIVLLFVFIIFNICFSALRSSFLVHCLHHIYFAHTVYLQHWFLCAVMEWMTSKQKENFNKWANRKIVCFCQTIPVSHSKQKF